MRPRLTPEQREAKRKERSRFTFSDAAYKHYDPQKDGYGSTSEWEEIARQVVGETVHVSTEAKETAVRIFMANYNPKTREELMRDFRLAARATHPDLGGKAESFRRVVSICDRIKYMKGW